MKMLKRELLAVRTLVVLFIAAGESFFVPCVAQPALSAASFLSAHEKGFVIDQADSSKNASYFRALADTGANIGRVFFRIPKDDNGAAFRLDDSALAVLNRVLGFAQQQRIKLVVVADFADVEKSGFWTDDKLEQSFVEIWRQLAKKIGNDPRIGGLDLMNEPNPQSPGGLSKDQDKWFSLADATIKAIRDQGVRLPIIFESVVGGQAQGFKDLKPFRDAEVVYSFHYYVPHDITHQQVNPRWSRTIPYPAGIDWGLGGWDPQLGVTAIDRSRLELEMREVIAFQEKYKVPIYVGEFSCVRWAPNGSSTRFVRDAVEIFDKHGWSWTYHEFRAWPGWDAEIDSENPKDTLRSADAPTMKVLRNSLASVTK